MKKLLLSIIIILILCGNIYADVYVLFNSETKDVQDVSPDNSAVIEDGFQKIVIAGDVSDYPLVDCQDYKFINNRFVLNVEKVNQKSIESSKTIEKSEELKKIRLKSDLMAKKELEKEGVVFKQVKDDDFSVIGVDDGEKQ